MKKITQDERKALVEKYHSSSVKRYVEHNGEQVKIRGFIMKTDEMLPLLNSLEKPSIFVELAANEDSQLTFVVNVLDNNSFVQSFDLVPLCPPFCP